MNIYFIDGYEKKIKDPDSDKYYTIQKKKASVDDWKGVIAEEENYLGTSSLSDKYIFSIFVNCKKASL